MQCMERQAVPLPYIGSHGRHRPPTKNRARENSGCPDLDVFSTSTFFQSQIAISDLDVFSKERLWTLTFFSMSDAVYGTAGRSIAIHRERWQAPAAQEKSSSRKFRLSRLRRFFDFDFFSKSNHDFGLRRFFKGAAPDFNFFSISDAVYGTAGRSIAIHRERWQAPAAQEKSSSRKFRLSRLRRFFDFDFFSKSNDDFGLRRFLRKIF